ncbi:hypothetical protein MMC30_009077 [Trapelia coarctata]|nr:hypothetical protein [Trapelia coarctata]
MEEYNSRVTVLETKAKVQDTRINVLEKQMKTLLKHNASMSGRDPLKINLGRQKQFNITPSDEILGLSMLSAPKNIPFTSTQTARVVNNGHRMAHRPDLDQMYTLLSQHKTYAATKHYWAKEQPDHDAALNRLSLKEFVTTYLRFPEDRVKHAVEQRGPLYHALDKYFKLRV